VFFYRHRNLHNYATIMLCRRSERPHTPKPTKAGHYSSPRFYRRGVGRFAGRQTVLIVSPLTRKAPFANLNEEYGVTSPPEPFDLTGLFC